MFAVKSTEKGRGFHKLTDDIIFVVDDGVLFSLLIFEDEQPIMGEDLTVIDESIR